MDDAHVSDGFTWRRAIEQVLREAGQPLPYREIANRVIASGFPTAGQTPERTVSRELTTHPDLFKRVGDGVYELARQTSFEELDDYPEVEAILSSVEPKLARPSSGQGFQSLVHVRRATELHAMRRAQAHFAEQGWQVEDVSALKPFDLLCTQSQKPDLNIEVKGSTGDGTKIMLTRGEVKHARGAFPNMALFVLHHISVEVSHTGITTYGGSPWIVLPWDVRLGVLEPLSYSYLIGS